MIQIAFQLTQKELYKGLLAISKNRSGTKLVRLIGIRFTLGSVLILISEIVISHPLSWYAWLFLVFSLYITFSPELLI